MSSFDTKIVFGAIAVLISLPGYALYINNTLKGKSKPQFYSWLIWGTLAAIGFSSQVSSGAGPGSWVTGATVLGCGLIALLALFKGEKKLSNVDKLLLALSAVAVTLRVLTDKPLEVLLLAIFAALIGYVFTSKKAYYHPENETVLTYILNSVKFFPSLFALSTVSKLTFIYPFSMMLANAWLAGLILVRRRKIDSQQIS
jgi:hypothetical protein